MLFVIHAFDKEDAHPTRMANYPAHRDFLSKAGERNVDIVMSGPLTSDDGTKPIGSLMVISAPDRTSAETFHYNDPFYLAGIWQSTTVTAFDKKRG